MEEKKILLSLEEYCKKCECLTKYEYMSTIKDAGGYFLLYQCKTCLDNLMAYTFSGSRVKKENIAGFKIS